MRLNRCPACGAACSETADWCTLCYADLRPKPAVEVAPPVEAVPWLVGGGTQGASETSEAADPTLDAPVFTAAAAATAVAREARWPCGACGELVPLEEPACTVCGAPFLHEPVAVPMGGIAAMAPGRRAVLMAIGAFVATAVFMLLMALVGSLL